MRIISFSRKWDKLKQAEFTTFRFTRKDKDWQVGEQVQVYYKNRSVNRERLGEALIISKEPRAMGMFGDKTGCQHITNDEAVADGFPDVEVKHGYFFMWEFLWDYYGAERLLNEPMNKLTLKWMSTIK